MAKCLWNFKNFAGLSLVWTNTDSNDNLLEPESRMSEYKAFESVFSYLMISFQEQTVTISKGVYWFIFPSMIETRDTAS